MVPLFESEREHARKAGCTSLLARFDERGIDPEFVDVNRAPVV